MSFAQRLVHLQERLAALREQRPVELGLFDRARSMFVEDDGIVELSALHLLDAELDRAGVHTSSDARLLKQLSEVRGSVGALARGLTERAETSVGQFEVALTEMERLKLQKRLRPENKTQVETDFIKLLRVVKVAAIFESPRSSSFERFARAARVSLSAPASAKVATAEYLFSRAQENQTDPSKQRADLNRAKEVLLLLGSAQSKDKERVRTLKVELGTLKNHDSLASSPRSLHRLVQNLRSSVRKNPNDTYRQLHATYQRALFSKDDELAAAAGLALETVMQQSSVEQAVERNLSKQLLSAPRSNLEQAKRPAASHSKPDQVADELTKLAFGLDDDAQAALSLASGCAHYFDIEESLSQEVSETDERRTKPVLRSVPYPTQNLVFDVASTLDDLQNFIITHPQMLVLDLASGRQLKRSYLEEEKKEKPKSVKKTAVRVYVLDASGSMYGERAKFRDAILISELNSIRVRAKMQLPFDPLYYCFFNDFAPDLVRIDSGALAAKHIATLIKESPASGQTDITYAAVSAFDSIRKAQGVDPYLAKATIVLVTDGEDAVDLDMIRKVQEPFASLQVSLSFISLGEENPDLKNLVLEQREKGKRAFYHHLSDAEISLIPSEFDSAFRTLIPMDVDVTGPIAEQLMPHLEALEAIAQRRVVKPVESNESQFDTLFPATCISKSKLDVKLVERIADILDAVADTASLASPEQRASESVALLIHLLEVYSLSVPLYLQTLNPNAKTLVGLVERVRLLCRMA
jgi:Mg-chelatase subunit ChlD